jgi:TonB-linked SusC/RagA family outer membrane protein
MNYNKLKIPSSVKFFGLFFTMLLFTIVVTAQVKISGRVTDGKGNGVPGISVTVKGNSTGAFTNAAGFYQLTTALNNGSYTLIFTGVGYKLSEQNFTVNGNADVSVNTSLKNDALGLDEVVVIGSSLTQTRKQLGNTVNTVNAKQLQNTGSGNIGAALQGKVAGAQISQTSGDPSGGISVRMRGTSTITGSSEPLYVIDGVIVNNNTTNVTNLNVPAGNRAEIGTNRMADINPNDIEKLDVIPGAAASAIYGSRASNGVVLITTKKGKAGQMKIDFSTSLVSNSLRKKVYISTYGKQFGTAGLRLGNISNASTSPTPYTGATIAYTRPDGILRTLATDLVDVTRYDYQDQIFQKGLGTDNYISLSGGSDRTKYYFSGGFYKNEGIVRGTDFRRYNLKTRIEQTVSKYLTILGGVAYTNSFSNEKPNGNVFWSPINSINITNNLYDITQRDAAGNLKAVEPTRVNPLSVINDMSLTQAVNRTISDLQIKIKPINGLSIDYIIGMDNIAQEGNNAIKRYPYISAQEGLGYASSALVNTFAINNDLNISYITNFSKFSSQTVVGFNHQYQKITGLFNEGRDMLNGISTINGAAVILPSRYSDDRRQVFGGFAQETFGYNNIVYLTLAGRIDGSTSFPKDSRTYFYPKVSASWNLSDMSFWQNMKQSFISSARLRASWGEAGNLTGISSYGRFTNYTASNINGVATYNLNTALGNEIVAPERASEFEFGTDLAFLNNKLGLTFTVYDKKIIDNSLLVQRTLAPSSGGSARFENVGNLTNKGWELGLNATPIQNTNFSWNIFGSVARNKNLLTASTQIAPITLDNNGGSPSVLLAGYALGSFYGNYFKRDANGSLTLDAGGRPIAETTTGTNLARKIIGNPNPDWIISAGTNFEYKKLSLSFLLDGAQGQEVFNADRRTRQGVGIGDYAEKEAKGQLPRGYIWSIYATEEWRVESGSYIKLREVSLSYQLPSIAKFIKSSSVSVTGRNLISWDTYDGYDPETNAGGNSAVLRGIDFGNVPIPKTVQVTLRATF